MSARSQVGLVMLALGCGRAAGDASTSEPRGLACETDSDCESLDPSSECGRDGFCEHAAGGDGRQRVELAAECPASSDDDFGRVFGTEPTWVRDTTTGLCCPFESHFGARRGWFGFPSEEECLTSCRCAEVSARGYEKISLECGCEEWSSLFPASIPLFCSMNLERALVQLCEQSHAAWRRVEGCGRVALRLAGGFSGGEAVYDAATGELVGLFVFSDESSNMCEAGATLAGREFDCESAVSCAPCGADAGPDVPACD